METSKIGEREHGIPSLEQSLQLQSARHVASWHPFQRTRDAKAIRERERERASELTSFVTGCKLADEGGKRISRSSSADELSRLRIQHPLPFTGTILPSPPLPASVRPRVTFVDSSSGGESSNSRERAVGMDRLLQDLVEA
jgi:hypothetical protein